MTQAKPNYQSSTRSRANTQVSIDLKHTKGEGKKDKTGEGGDTGTKGDGSQVLQSWKNYTDYTKEMKLYKTI